MIRILTKDPNRSSIYAENAVVCLRIILSENTCCVDAGLKGKCNRVLASSFLVFRCIDDKGVFKGCHCSSHIFADSLFSFPGKQSMRNCNSRKAHTLTEYGGSKHNVFDCVFGRWTQH